MTLTLQKQALAKLLEKLIYAISIKQEFFYWSGTGGIVKCTEWFHLVHEAKQIIITRGLESEYVNQLSRVCKDRHIAFATLEEQMEAALKTLNLWQETNE